MLPNPSQRVTVCLVGFFARSENECRPDVTVMRQFVPHRRQHQFIVESFGMLIAFHAIPNVAYSGVAALLSTANDVCLATTIARPG